MDEQLNRVNPLMDFARKVECSVKIPSQGLLYDEDAIDFNSIGEVDIMPMLPNDELSIINPETLISGNAIVSLIKSCCPSVHSPGDLFYPDVNALLLGIRKATYGDEIIQQGMCPQCWSQKVKEETEEIKKYLKENNINEEDLSEEESKDIYKKISNQMATHFTELEKMNKIRITPIEYKYSIDELMQQMKMLPNETSIETKDGLKIYLTPYKCKDKILFSQRSINERKILDYYEKTLKKEVLSDENINDYLNKTNRMLGMYSTISDKSLDILASSVLKIALPDKRIVTDPDFIKEYIKNISSDLVIKIQEKVQELNNYGIPQTLDMKCPCCGHQWKETFYGFNQSDFFGISS